MNFWEVRGHSLYFFFLFVEKSGGEGWVCSVSKFSGSAPGFSM